MHLDELVATLLEKMRTISSSEAIVGRAIDIGDTHVIPVCELSIGFGSGGGSGDGHAKRQTSTDGGAVAGGLSISPVAFVVVDPNGRAHLESLKHKRSSAVTKVIDLLPKLGQRLLDDNKDAPAPEQSKS